MRIPVPRLAGFALVGLALVGCGAPATVPKTYPVKGRVVYDSAHPVTAGLIEFRSESDPSLTCRSAIEADGSFTLRTLTESNQGLDGAVAGAHTVIVTPAPDDPAKQGNVQSITLPDRVIVKEEANNFPDLKIKRPRP
jgi:hypothetical protein